MFHKTPPPIKNTLSLKILYFVQDETPKGAKYRKQEKLGGVPAFFIFFFSYHETPKSQRKFYASVQRYFERQVPFREGEGSILLFILKTRQLGFFQRKNCKRIFGRRKINPLCVEGTRRRWIFGKKETLKWENGLFSSYK